jgi:hypothetical protein
MKTELTNEEYHKAEGVSSSDFRLLQKSPIHYENKNLFKLDGAKFTLGSLVHKMVLEPDDISDEFIKEEFEGCTLNKNTKAYKEAKALFIERIVEDGLTVVPVDEWEKAEKMASNVMAIAGGLLQNGVAEESFFVEDKMFDITRKCRPDYYREDLGLVIDLKTTGDGSEYGFSKSLYDYAYHRQASWYLDTLSKDGINATRFIFITVESKKPYMVDVWEIDPLSLERGREQYTDLLIEWKRYKDKGIANVVKTISLPAWAFKDEQ